MIEIMKEPNVYVHDVQIRFHWNGKVIRHLKGKHEKDVLIKLVARLPRHGTVGGQSKKIYGVTLPKSATEHLETTLHNITLETRVKTALRVWRVERTSHLVPHSATFWTINNVTQLLTLLGVVFQLFYEIEECRAIRVHNHFAQPKIVGVVLDPEEHLHWQILVEIIDLLGWQISVGP